MFEVVYKDCKWYISENGKICEDLGSFIDPISPKIIVEELNGELQIRCEGRSLQTD
jgi:hypothetical protein